MGRVEVVAERVGIRDKAWWREVGGGLLFCASGGRKLGLRWNQGALAAIEWSPRPIKRGIRLVVTSAAVAELAGEALRPPRGGGYAVSHKLEELVAKNRRLGLPVYIRVVRSPVVTPEKVV